MLISQRFNKTRIIEVYFGGGGRSIQWNEQLGFSVSSTVTTLSCNYLQVTLELATISSRHLFVEGLE